MPSRLKLIVVVVSLSLITCASEDDRLLFGKLLRKAQQGNPEAQYHVGMMFNNGLGTQKDPNAAFSWFERSANAGDPLGAYKVGCYLGGQFAGVVPTDLKKSLEYKLIAARAGYSLAQHDVAVAYFEQRRFHEALDWWDQAAKQGSPMSLYVLASIYAEGNVGPRDRVRAYAYFKLANLMSEGRVDERAQGWLDGITGTMSAAEREAAEHVVSEWKSVPTELTIKAMAGLEEARKIVDAF